MDFVGGILHGAQECRSIVIVYRLNLRISTVGGKKVLRQVVAAHAEEIRVFRYFTNREDNGGDLQHHAERDAVVECQPFITHRTFDLFEDFTAPDNFINVGDHRDHDFGIAKSRGAEDSLELHGEKVAITRISSHRPEAEKRVFFFADAHIVDRLITANVEGAEDNRLPLCNLYHLAVELSQFVVVRCGFAVHE